MEEFFFKVRQLIEESEEVYIYGAGLYGQNIWKILAKHNLHIDGFVVTCNEKEKKILNLPVKNIDDLIDKNIGIIIGVNRHNAVAVKKELENRQIDMDKVVWGNEFIDNNGVRGGYDEIPTIEITTKIGCKVNCKFCPQDLLIREYFKNRPDRESFMSMETFSKCLEKMPENCTILFSGMAEPFLNPKCCEMIKLACATGRKVDLYTTLVGADEKDIEQISDMPLGFVTLHVADKFGYAHIPVTELYYKQVEYLINAKKKDGTTLVNVCNAQAEPDLRIQEICNGKYEILTTMLDRAGNLKNKKLYGKQILKGVISCSLCGQKLNHNILLPDGSLLLCCMDYGMRHVLGNLLDSHYDEIINGDEMNRIKLGLMEDESVDILCRKCSCANLCV